MSIRGVVVCAILCVSAVAFAADTARLQAMLDDAKRIRATDRQRARQLLDEVERDPAAKTDPILIARTQSLECRWADTAAAAYRAANIGLAAADRAKSAPLRAKLMDCHARALMLDGKTAAAEQEYGAVITLAKTLHDAALEAEASTDIGVLEYERGAMADALAHLQTAYRLNGELGDEAGRLDALADIANVYADSNVAQYDRAIEYYRELLGAYEKRGQPGDVADTLFNIGSTSEAKGELAAAELHYRRALTSFQ
jgi:tetratricopeptide (TPR) repeat protein